VIATGARPRVPQIPGLEEAGYFTNETIFTLAELPRRLAVIGAGPVGCELAQAFQRLLDMRNVAIGDALIPLAKVGLARAYALQGDNARSRLAYQDFFALWKDADPDVPLLREVKAEYAKVQ
jgi:hypothetical protein